ncbi:CynX/NimT family MFS transporter [Texcoconibacillus texcoconensis]|uniref:CP family cyanate transporter-like MFS transporter n=1 Tax=Texcoconibacillus texcoconensis TaxID=1095777 RepID=A0A840QMA5_9BACI|nr:MFS transporter [Texcoconibacillus texcoconensis]MBB5172512.1 CP family cyanate transporter-like MFS transporter [Texcoconibacillus texcoconensis]
MTKRTKQIWLIVGILFVAFNLRPAIMAVGPLVPLIREDTGVSNSFAGMLTTIPLLSFAVFSLVAPKLSIRFGISITIFAALLTLFIGIILRSLEVIPALLIGTILIGTGIAICNVLLPSIIKLTFPYRIGIMTSLYTAAMGIFASLSAGISVPLAEEVGLGWSNALAVWGIIALLAMFFWIPQMRSDKGASSQQTSNATPRSIWKEPLAWYVTLFMGFQSFLFYNVIAWLPNVLHSLGLTLTLAGWMMFWMQILSIPGNFAVPIIASKTKNEKPIVAAVCSLYLVSFSGLLLTTNPTLVIIFVLVLGFAQGMAFSLALTLLGLRAPTPEDSSRLSGMAQSFGYLVASVGPVLMGTLYDLFQTWQPFLITLFAVNIVIFTFGWRAGEDRHVFEEKRSPAKEA